MPRHPCRPTDPLITVVHTWEEVEQQLAAMAPMLAAKMEGLATESM